MIESENGGLEKKIPGGQSTFRDGPCNPRSVRGGDGNLGGGGNSLKKILNVLRLLRRDRAAEELINYVTSTPRNR